MRRGGLEAELGRELREAPIPIDAAAEERVLRLALAQHADRRTPPRSPLPRLAVALAVALALGALLLTPAWAAVRDWVGDTFRSAPPPAPHRGLGPLPGGGRLLVQTPKGAWIVAPDGGRHLLRGSLEASWSPRGLFVIGVHGARLEAVEPDGTPHWSLPATEPIHDPRWAPSGELVAYRRGAGLRVLAGDGSEDRPLDESVAPVAPAWDPTGRPDLAYVDARGALRVIDVASHRAAVTSGALHGVRKIEWAGTSEADGGGGVLLEASARQIDVRAIALGSPARGRLGGPFHLHVPPGATVRDATLSPDGRTVAALLAHRTPGRGQITDLVLYSARTGAAHRLGSVPGRLTEVAWAPRGGRLLVAWPSFDEWLFLPRHFAEGTAMTGIAAAFRTPAGAPFPAVAGWCCRARSAAAP